MSHVKVLTIGDQHIKPSNIPEVDIFLTKLDEYLSRNKPDIIISMGDLLHTHEKLYSVCLNKVVEYVNILRKHAPTYILVGNHDFFNNQEYLNCNHWLNVLKEYDNVKIVDDVFILNYNSGDNRSHNIKLTLCPYVPDGRFKEALNTKKGEWEDSNCIFAHQLLDGAKMGAITAENIEKWNDTDPMLIGAHIHDKQWVQNNFYIVGSVLQEAFGESDDKSILLLTLNPNDKIVNKDNIVYEEINLDLPKKKILYIDMDELENFNIDKLNLSTTEYKLTINGNCEEFEAFKKTTKYKELIKKVKIVFKHKREYLQHKKKEYEDIKDIDISKKQNFNNILQDLITKEENPFLDELMNTIVYNNSNKLEHENIIIL